MKFYSAKGNLVIILICFLTLMTILTFVEQVYIITLVLSLVTAYAMWMWFDTYYVIVNDQLIFKSALLKGSINIDSIIEIVKNKKLYAGIKPSLSNKGIVIKYNRWDDIYLSPKDDDQFIDVLKGINPNIKISE